MSIIDNTIDASRESAEWIVSQLLVVLGQGTPREQMATSLVLAAAAWVSTAVTTGLTIFLALFFTATFLWGLARLLFRSVMG